MHGDQGIMHVGACSCCYESVARVVFLSRNPRVEVCSHVALCIDCFQELDQEGILRCPIDKQEVIDIFIFPEVPCSTCLLYLLLVFL